jgi:hypothetical protein
VLNETRWLAVKYLVGSLVGADQVVCTVAKTMRQMWAEQLAVGMSELSSGDIL